MFAVRFDRFTADIVRIDKQERKYSSFDSSLLSNALVNPVVIRYRYRKVIASRRIVRICYKRDAIED